MTTTQRVDVARFDCTSGGANWCNGCYTMERHDDGDYVLHDDYAALLQQLAERDAEVEFVRSALRNRGEYIEGQPPLPLALAAYDHMRIRAEAAERAREEACGLLRDVIAWRRTVSIDETPNRKDGGISGRIAAFLAANK